MCELAVDFVTAAGHTQAVRSVSFRLEPGKTLALVGESGSGKSVTAHSILRLLPITARHPQGSISYQGQDLLQASERQMRKIRGNRIAMIFQEPMSALNPLHTVGRQISEILQQHKGWARQKQQRVPLSCSGWSRSASRKSACTPIRTSCPAPAAAGNDCHGAGQRAGNPIADEPTTALDVTVQQKILALLKNQQQLGMAILLISHDLNMVRRVADQVCVMQNGLGVENRPCVELFDHPQHPYTVPCSRRTRRRPGSHHRR